MNCSSKPTDDLLPKSINKLMSYYRLAINNHIEGVISANELFSLSSIFKTNEYQGDSKNFYTIEFSGTLLSKQTLYFFTDGYRKRMTTLIGKELHLGYGYKLIKEYSANEPFGINGKIKFRKTEKGWLPYQIKSRCLKGNFVLECGSAAITSCR